MSLLTGAVSEGFLALAALVGLLIWAITILGEGGHRIDDVITVTAAVDFASFMQSIVIVMGNETQNVSTQRQPLRLSCHRSLRTVLPMVTSLTKTRFT